MSGTAPGLSATEGVLWVLAEVEAAFVLERQRESSVTVVCPERVEWSSHPDWRVAVCLGLLRCARIRDYYGVDSAALGGDVGRQRVRWSAQGRTWIVQAAL